MGAMVYIGLVIFLGIAEVQTAIQSCQDERDRVAAERDAFESFQTRIKKIDPVELDLTDAHGHNLGGQLPTGELSADPEGTSLKYVLTAYESSVRSLSHYKAGYDETLAESLAAELGEDVVTALVTNTVLTPATQKILIERSGRAISARTALVDAINDEIDALINNQEALTTIERKQQNLRAHLDSVQTHRKEAVFDVWCRLYELEAELDSIAQQRQAALNDLPVEQPMGPNGTDEQLDFYEYLYQNSDASNHPVLSAIGTLGAQIRADRSQLSTRFG